MVFGVAKERVGLRGRGNGGWGRGGEGEEGEGGEGDGDGEGEEGDGDGDGDGEGEEGGYTMDMMLKDLNVELAVVGFDKVGQRWVG